MSGDYLDPLAEELVTGYQVAWYQQRGIAPSTESGPHSVDQHVGDVAAVLDHLGWDHALVVGHSWGGFLVVAVAARAGRPDAGRDGRGPPRHGRPRRPGPSSTRT